MPTFADNAGRTWTVAVNVDAIRRVRNTLDVNLLDAVSDDGQLLERLVVDPILLCDVLYVLVQPQAQAQGVSDEDFGRALGGDALDHATQALLEGLASFFPSAKAALLRKAIAKLRALEHLAIEQAAKQLDSDELDRQMRAAIGLNPGDSSINSPASSA